jgi:glutaredoxin
MIFRKCLLCVFFLTVSATAQAEIFRWFDENGNVQFGDRPPVSSNAKRIKIEVNSYEGVTVKPFEAFKRDGLQASSGVVMYSTTWCGVCKRARRFLRQRNIPFQEYDIENSRKGKRDYAQLKGSGVPILLVGGKRMNGFSVDRFNRLYDSRKN